MRRTIYRRSEPSEGVLCRLVAVGDIMLSGEVARRHPGGSGAAGLFSNVVPVLRSGDIVFGNLETPLCDGPAGRTLFRGDPAMASVLAAAGFNVLALANNHILDYGPEGLRQCAQAVASAGIQIVGAGESQEVARRPLVVESRGLRVGFLGFARTLQKQRDPSAPGFVEWEERLAMRSVQSLKSIVDCVVVSLHIGLMWIDYPKPAFKEVADRLLEAGAHVVLMHHAHVLQGYYAEDGRLTVYSLGNFVADIQEGEIGVNPVPGKQRESAIFLIDLDRDGVLEVGIVPIVITDVLAVSLAGEERARQIATRLERISHEIRSGAYRMAFEQQRAELHTEHFLAWLFVHLRRGNWRELARGLLRARPEHLRMLSRFTAERLGALWRQR